MGIPFSAKMTLKDRYGFGGFSGTPPSEPILSTPPPPPRPFILTKRERGWIYKYMLHVEVSSLLVLFNHLYYGILITTFSFYLFIWDSYNYSIYRNIACMHAHTALTGMPGGEYAIPKPFSTYDFFFWGDLGREQYQSRYGVNSDGINSSVHCVHYILEQKKSHENSTSRDSNPRHLSLTMCTSLMLNASS